MTQSPSFKHESIPGVHFKVSTMNNFVIIGATKSGKIEKSFKTIALVKIKKHLGIRLFNSFQKHIFLIEHYFLLLYIDTRL